MIQKKHVDQLVKALDTALRKNAESRDQHRKEDRKEEKKTARPGHKAVHAHA